MRIEFERGEYSAAHQQLEKFFDDAEKECVFFQVSINAKYLLDLAKGMNAEDDQVILAFRIPDPELCYGTPIYVRGFGSDAEGVIMPIALNKPAQGWKKEEE